MKVQAPIIRTWSELPERLESYVKRGTYDDNEIVTGEVYEKLLELYTDSDALIELPYHIIHNRIFYYLKDVMDLIIRNRPDNAVKFDALFKHMTVTCAIEFLRAKMIYGGFLTKSDIWLTFGIRSDYGKMAPEPAFLIGIKRVWTIEQVRGMVEKEYKKKCNYLRNHHVFGLADAGVLQYTGRCNPEDIRNIVNYLEDPKKDIRREQALGDIKTLLVEYKDIMNSVARHI